MNYFLLLRYFLEHLNHLIFAFWWMEKRKFIGRLGKNFAPKCEGGLGFRNLYAFNLAMLAKQGWRLINESNSLVAKVLKAKYFPNCSFMEASFKNEASLCWKSIYNMREIFSRETRWQVGNGEKIKIWNDA